MGLMSVSSIHDGQWWTQSCSGLRQIAMMLQVHGGAIHVKSRRQHFAALLPVFQTLLSLFPFFSWALVGNIGLPLMGHLIVDSRLSSVHWPAVKLSITNRCFSPRMKAPLNFRCNYKSLVGSLLPGPFSQTTALGSSWGHMSSTVSLTLTRYLVPRRNSLWRVPLLKSESSLSPLTVMSLLHHRAHLAWQVDKVKIVDELYIPSILHSILLHYENKPSQSMLPAQFQLPSSASCCHFALYLQPWGLSV